MNLASLEGQIVIFRADIESIYLNKSTSSYKYPNQPLQIYVVTGGQLRQTVVVLA